MQTPAEKIRMLKQSLGCFYLALAGLVPVLGLPFAVAAVRARSRVQLESQGEWNAAQPYLRRGLILAVVGTLVSLMTLLLIGLALINRAMN